MKHLLPFLFVLVPLFVVALVLFLFWPHSPTAKLIIRGLMVVLPCVMFVMVLAGCAGPQAQQSAQQAGQDVETWLQSPVVQQQIGLIENFAFTALDTYLQTSVFATAPGSIPNFTPAESNVVPKVQKQYGLTPDQATYVVRKAEQRWLSNQKAAARKGRD